MASLVNVAAALFVTSFVVALVVGEMWWIVARASARRPEGIATRLRSPRDRHTVKVGPFFSAAWNPGASHLEPLRARGVATYWRDGDQFHLDFQPLSGPSRAFAGPLPDIAIPGTRAYQAHRAVFRALLWMFIGCGVTILFAAVAGFVMANGTSTARLSSAFIGGAVGFLALLLLAHLTSIVRGLRNRRRGSTTT